MKIIRMPFRLRFASAVTIWPFILLSAEVSDWSVPRRAMLLKHEGIHVEQQRRWAVKGLGVGLLAWWFLYLFALPLVWNPWRRKWETEAYYACGWSLPAIDGILEEKPYWLFF